MKFSDHQLSQTRTLSQPAMAQRAFARLQTLQNQLAPFDASVLEGHLEPRLSARTSIGLGFFEFEWRKYRLSALHQTLGEPVGVGNASELYTNLVLFTKREHSQVLAEFCQELVQESERTQAGFVNVFEWHPTQQFWQARVVCPARRIDSVVLDEGLQGPSGP
eukprot:Skav228039  [mRNA]  locus=scaffold1188:102239:105256:+ [translate_table: standard]